MRYFVTMVFIMLLPGVATAAGNFYANDSVLHPVGGVACDCTWTADAVPKRSCACGPGECVFLKFPFPNEIAGECTDGDQVGNACTVDSFCTGAGTPRCAAEFTGVKVHASINSTTTADKIYACAQMQVTPSGGDYDSNNGAAGNEACASAQVTATANESIVITLPSLEAHNDEKGTECDPTDCKNSPGVLRLCNPATDALTYPDQASGDVEYHFVNGPWVLP